MSNEILPRNVQRWGTYCPTGVKQLLSSERSDIKIPEETTEEAEKWFKGLDLYNVTTLFVYGVGSGKYYRAAKDWLLENQERQIVFLEDDPEVIYRLFETELGKELIFDKQVWLELFQWDQKKNKEEKNEEWLSSLPFFFFLGDIQISSNASYKTSKEKKYTILSNHLQYLKNIKLWFLTEHIYLGKGFFNNFYRNLFDIPNAQLSDLLFKKFEGIPAIICGGGPSLDKNRELLEKLKDRALIFGGGSAMNVLNETGFNPHFGVGIDPNSAQYSRLTMNQAFAVPYFYRARMYSEALDSIFGEHIYVRGAAGYDISSWVEEKLGLNGERMPEGNNVVNFSLAIANALGCNPIIFVGVDLAYTNLASYGKGVLGHPLYDFNKNLSSKGLNEELMIKKDIFGNDTYTLWKWMMESIWYTEYALSHPDLTLINSTEGGIGFERVPNMPLEEAAEKFLGKQYDFGTWIHGELQNAKMPEGVTAIDINRTLGELGGSLAKCEEYCGTLTREFNKMIQLDKKGEELPKNVYGGTVGLIIEKLNQEAAYTHLLAQFNESYMSFAGKSFTEILVEELNEQDQHKARMKKISINKKRYEFLMSVCHYNRSLIKHIVQESAIRKAVSDIPGAEKSAPKTVPSWDIPNGEARESLYPSGKVKSRQSTKNGLFHGPSVFYCPEGKILAHSNYIEGKKEGEAWLFYDSGEVYSVQNFKDDKWHGKQEFFYRNGVRKTLMNYKNGQLDGDVLLFHLNGKMYRKLFFKNGKRDGKEMLWNMGGFLEFEAEYKNNSAIGICRAWYGNGNIAREVLYDHDSNPYSVRQWNLNGSLLPEASFQNEDYFQAISKQTTALTQSLGNLCNQLEKLSPLFPDSTSEGKGNPHIKKDIENLKLEMEKLQKMEEQLRKHGSADPVDGKEPIWKTPAARRMMGKQLEEATRKMAEDIALMQEALRLTSDIMKKDDNLESKKS